MKAISHFYSWEHLSKQELACVSAEFSANNLHNLSLNGETCARLTDPAFMRTLRQEFRKHMLVVHDCHAPHMPGWEFNSADGAVLEHHLRLLDLYAELGCDTVTVHAGTNDGGEALDVLRERTNRVLDALILRARKLGLIIALENTIFPTDTPEELLGYLARFRCESFGLCFDAGHANLMDYSPGKTSEKMIDWIRQRWHGNVRFEKDTLALLLSDIVTCHLHDNDGYDDQHKLPGTGTIDWRELLTRLEQAPRLRSFQNESGHLKYGIPPSRIAACFDKLSEEYALTV